MPLVGRRRRSRPAHREAHGTCLRLTSSQRRRLAAATTVSARSHRTLVARGTSTTLGAERSAVKACLRGRSHARLGDAGGRPSSLTKPTGGLESRTPSRELGRRKRGPRTARWRTPSRTAPKYLQRRDFEAVSKTVRGA